MKVSKGEIKNGIKYALVGGGIVLTSYAIGYVTGNRYASVRMARGIEMCCLKHPELYPKLVDAIKEVNLRYVK